MVNSKFFDEETRKIYMLTRREFEGKAQRDIIYEKLKGCNMSDFQQACNDDDLIEEVSRFGLNYAVIRKYVSRYRGVRETEEERLENLKLMREIKEGKDIMQSDEFKKMIAAVKSL